MGHGHASERLPPCVLEVDEGKAMVYSSKMEKLSDLLLREAGTISTLEIGRCTTGE